MDINRLKLIDKVLGIVVIVTFIIALFYRQLLLEVGVLGLFWLLLDTYVAFKTSKLNFAMDILFIAAVVIVSILAPNLFCVSTLASIMPSTSIPKETLAKLVIAGGLLVIVVLYAVDVVRMIREVEIVL
ncbi:MAG: hypothetical protein L7H04_06370 [Vulcanisaeta sp.]|nr:hypothetical protein [Vulcanisaeta sp.]